VAAPALAAFGHAPQVVDEHPQDAGDVVAGHVRPDRAGLLGALGERGERFEQGRGDLRGQGRGVGRGRERAPLVVDDAERGLHDEPDRQVRLVVGDPVEDRRQARGHRPLEQRPHQRLLVGEVAEQGADAHAGAVGDRLQGRVGSLLGEDRVGGLQQAARVARGIGAEGAFFGGHPRILASRTPSEVEPPGRPQVIDTLMTY
jgi:hypothetical protein